jgi:hypothetical protein
LTSTAWRNALLLAALCWVAIAALSVLVGVLVVAIVEHA